MMAESDLVTFLFYGGIVKNAPSQARAESARCLPFRHDRFDERISITLNYLEWNVEPRQVFRQHLLREPRLLLVEVYRQQVKADRGAPLQVQQQRKQGIAILAAAQTHHDLVAIVDHLEIGDGASGAAQKLLFCCLGAPGSRFRHDCISCIELAFSPNNPTPAITTQKYTIPGAGQTCPSPAARRDFGADGRRLASRGNGKTRQRIGPFSRMSA